MIYKYYARPLQLFDSPFVYNIYNSILDYFFYFIFYDWDMITTQIDIGQNNKVKSKYIEKKIVTELMLVYISPMHDKRKAEIFLNNKSANNNKLLREREVAGSKNQT